MKKRVNISIGEHLHEEAVSYAKSIEMDFSELLSTLLREKLEEERRERFKASEGSRNKPSRR